MTTPFNIFQLTEETVKEVEKFPPVPHRHDHEELIILTEGNAEHFVDFKKEKVSAPSVIYVAQCRVHKFVPQSGARGWVIRFKAGFIPESKFHYYSCFIDNVEYMINPGYCLDNIKTLCELMKSELDLKPPDFNTIRHLIEALISKLETLGLNKLLPEENRNNYRAVTFKNFLKILEDNFRRPVGVEFYAEKLNMSIRNLNIICRELINKSVRELIETRKLIEARRLLLNTEKSVSEIGFELGYTEKSYFTRVFRGKTGSTPSQYRSQSFSISV
ncbi:MAG: helix-turn-helix domain-containing protein [Ignavibacteria bacterium]